MVTLTKTICSLTGILITDRVYFTLQSFQSQFLKESTEIENGRSLWTSLSTEARRNFCFRKQHFRDKTSVSQLLFLFRKQIWTTAWEKNTFRDVRKRKSACALTQVDLNFAGCCNIIRSSVNWAARVCEQHALIGRLIRLCWAYATGCLFCRGTAQLR